MSQHLPIPEVSGGLGAGAVSRLCAGVPVRVPLALLALHPERVRLLQISGPGERFPRSHEKPRFYLDIFKYTTRAIV